MTVNHITLIGLFFPHLGSSIPPPLQQIGIIRGEDGKLYEALLLKEISEVNPLVPELQPPIGGVREDVDLYNLYNSLNADPQLGPRDARVGAFNRGQRSSARSRLNLKKQVKKEYDAWILSNLG